MRAKGESFSPLPYLSSLLHQRLEVQSHRGVHGLHHALSTHPKDISLLRTQLYSQEGEETVLEDGGCLLPGLAGQKLGREASVSLPVAYGVMFPF